MALSLVADDDGDSMLGGEEETMSMDSVVTRPLGTPMVRNGTHINSANLFDEVDPRDPWWRTLRQVFSDFTNQTLMGVYPVNGTRPILLGQQGCIQHSPMPVQKMRAVCNKHNIGGTPMPAGRSSW